MSRYGSETPRSWARSLRGYFIVLTTPFTDQGELDIPGLRRNVEISLAIPGVAGFYVGSIYQEFWTLTMAERKLVAETVIEVTNGRVPVMIGITDPSARNAIDLARHADAAGADLLMLWPPTFGPRTDDGVFRYIEQVASVTDVGICTYSTTTSELGFYLGPELATRLLEIDNVCAMKEASRSLSGYTAMVEAVGADLVVSSPNEEYALFGLATSSEDRVQRVLLGSSRPLYAQTASQPRCAEFAEALARGDLPAASEALSGIVGIANRIHNRYVGQGAHNVSLLKYITSLHGMASGPVRPPLSEAPEVQILDARSVLSELAAASAR